MALDETTHSLTTNAIPPEKKIDLKDEDNLLNTLQYFKLFSNDTSPELQNIATKDYVTKNIEDDLLMARQKGQDHLIQFVEQRLLAGNNKVLSFRDPLSKNKPLTFSSVFEVEQKQSTTTAKKVVQADRKFLQRLVTAFHAGRDVHLEEILKHELMPVPPALAQLNGDLRSGQKSLLSDSLIGDTPCPQSLEAADIGEEGQLIVDGQAHVVALGKVPKAKNFGDLADTFVTLILQMGAAFSRIDVIFDRYYDLSIKSSTRKKWGRKAVPVRRHSRKKCAAPTELGQLYHACSKQS